MNKEKELKFVLQLKTRIISVNDLYKARVVYKYGKPVATIYKNPKAKEQEREVMDQLSALDLDEYKDWLRNTKQFKLHLQFVFNRNISKKDSSNNTKLIEDEVTKFIKEYLGIENYDDSKHVEVYCVKSIIPKAEHEYVCVSLTESKFNVRIDEIEKPERFFLGGTCNGTTWREELIPELEKHGYTYFNPVVPDWTPECIEIENIEKNEKCNTHLYILTPEMKGVYSVAEIINSTWECIVSGRGFVYVGILGGKNEWGEHQYKSLNETLRMIDNISSGNSRIKAGFINNVVDILNL